MSDAVRPILLYSEFAKGQTMESWMKDEKRYCEKDREKLEKGSGCVKAWTLASNWLYRFMRW